MVVVGGELTLDMLDLTFNPIAKFYEAPIQMKANGGVFVVDDFGRQRIPPRDLLNRWIVPLESRVDYLTLHTGRKFEIPFNVFIIFATNLKPESLADEAFLRRIPYKIRAKNPTTEEYTRIFEMNCRKRGLAFDPVMVEYLQRKYYQPRKLEMRACHPRDLVEQVVDMCRYQQREPAHHARPAGRGVRQLLPRRDQFPGQRTMKSVAVTGRAMPFRGRERPRPRQAERARASADRARQGWSSSTLFSAMAYPPRERLARDRTRHRHAAPGQREPGRRADAGPPIRRRGRSLVDGAAADRIRDVRTQPGDAAGGRRAGAGVADRRDLRHRAR